MLWGLGIGVGSGHRCGFWALVCMLWRLGKGAGVVSYLHLLFSPCMSGLS